MKITATSGAPKTVTFKTKDVNVAKHVLSWWKAGNKDDRGKEMVASAVFLKESQNYRTRQAAIYARLYGNLSLFNFIGTNFSKTDDITGLPVDRPTFNVIQSCTDTLISRISQTRPAPVFLTDNSDYKQRNLAKKLNNFILGEFYQTKAYELGTIILRDALVEGTGCLKVYETQDKKVGLERVLLTELLTDPNEGIYGNPRQLYQTKLIDRQVLMEMFPEYKNVLKKAEAAYPDNSADSSKTVSDLVMVVEGWHLRSGPEASDGRHTIACSAGTILDEAWDKDKFPFVFLHYSPRLYGFWSQGLAEQLMGTQVEINSLLYTISRSIKLAGVPRVFIEAGSKVLKTAFNNDIGTVVEYRGIKPSIEVSECVPQELYAQLQRLIEYAYQQCGVSNLQASGQKPAGLDSGEAQRVYDDIATDRFATLARRHDNFYIDLAYLIMDQAIDIAKRDGKYQTVYPNKDGTKEVDLPKAAFISDPFVIQCMNMSSLPRDPAGRMSKIIEMLQGGMISIKEARRLLDYPDLEQDERLAKASEERIFQTLDAIVEDGKYTPPDPFMDLASAEEICVQYYNLYVSAKLEEDKEEMLRTFFTQVQALKTQAMGGMMPPQPQQGGGQPNPPQATAQPLPQSPMITNANVSNIS